MILVPGPGDTGAPPGQIGMPNPPPPPAPLLSVSGRLRTGMGLGMLAWVHGSQQPPPSARRDRRQAQATGTDPQHLRSRRQG